MFEEPTCEAGVCSSVALTCEGGRGGHKYLLPTPSSVSRPLLESLASFGFSSVPFRFASDTLPLFPAPDYAVWDLAPTARRGPGGTIDKANGVFG